MPGLDPGAIGIVELVTDAGPASFCRFHGGDLLVGFRLGKNNGLHHGADDAVGKQQHGCAVSVGPVKGENRQIHGLLYGGGGQDGHAEAAVAAGFRCLEVVLLRGLNGADTRAAAGKVGIDHGDTGSGTVADPLAFQGNAGRRGGSHGAGSGRGGAVDHIDGSNFTLALNEGAADLGKPAGKILGDLILRGDGVTGKEPAAGTDSCLGDGLGALHESTSHIRFPSLTIDVDGPVGAHPGADRAADAVIGICRIYIFVSLRVNLPADGQDAFGTEFDAVAAAFASLFDNFNSA